MHYFITLGLKCKLRTEPSAWLQLAHHYRVEKVLEYYGIIEGLHC